MILRNVVVRIISTPLLLWLVRQVDLVGSLVPSCDQVENMARYYLSNRSWCPVLAQNDCANLNYCSNNCLYIPDSGASEVCYDGCLYRQGNYTVQRSVGVAVTVSEILVGSAWSPVTVEVYSLYFYLQNTPYKFGVGRSGSDCFAELNGMQCTCELVSCNGDTKDIRFQYDCTEIQGGIYVDECNPPLVNVTIDSAPIMAILLSVPNKVCNTITAQSLPQSDASHNGQTSTDLSTSANDGEIGIVLPNSTDIQPSPTQARVGTEPTKSTSFAYTIFKNQNIIAFANLLSLFLYELTTIFNTAV